MPNANAIAVQKRRVRKRVKEQVELEMPNASTHEKAAALGME